VHPMSPTSPAWCMMRRLGPPPPHPLGRPAPRHRRRHGRLQHERDAGRARKRRCKPIAGRAPIAGRQRTARREPTGRCQPPGGCTTWAPGLQQLRVADAHRLSGAPDELRGTWTLARSGMHTGCPQPRRHPGHDLRGRVGTAFPPPGPPAGARHHLMQRYAPAEASSRWALAADVLRRGTRLRMRG
jgi:hypothetical protein